MLPSQVNELLSSKPAQYSFAVSTVLLICTVIFALVWSIINNQPLNPVAGNILAFVLGAASSLLGGHTGATLYARGANTQAQALSSATANTASMLSGTASSTQSQSQTGT